METKKPIKRNPAIVEFSKEHHFVLLLTWKIKEGLKKSIDPERISRYVLHIFDTDLIRHFDEEEIILFSKLPPGNEQRIQVEAEHKNIKQLIAELRNKTNDLSLLSKFADTLEKHIRFEEREFFNHLQQNLNDNVLTEIASLIKPRTHESDTAWDDIFWEIKQ